MYTGTSIAKNTIYNLIGYGIPLIVALVVIPFLIDGLGVEKFGILNLAWIVIGYFGFFDFGIGRALTKIIAEKIGTKNTNEIPGIFWTSFSLTLSFSSIGAIIVLFFASTLVHDIFNISESLHSETLNTFYLLAVAIPIVTTTAGIRGFLEAYQKFGIISIIRAFLGISAFVTPLICLIFSNSLFWIVLVLVVIRIFVWIIYLTRCFKINKELRGSLSFDSKLIKPIIKLSGWMTVSNIVVPVFIYLDKFLIGALVSAAAITYYATPYEIITKLLIIPGALTGVLFPTISASYLNNPEFTKKVMLRSVKYILMLFFPVILLLLSFADTGLNLWLGEEFAEKSSFILQLLAIGVLFNSIAYVPYTFLEGIGRPDITAKIQLVELPFYLLAMWVSIKQNGINGAAFVWMLRVMIDSSLLFFFAKKQISSTLKFNLRLSHLLILKLMLVSIIPVFVYDISIKLVLVSIIIFSFAFISWKYLLLEDEKVFLFSHLKIFS